MNNEEFLRYFTERIIEKHIKVVETSDDPKEVASFQRSIDYQLNEYEDNYGENYLELREQRTQEDIDRLETEKDVHIYACAEAMYPKLKVLEGL